MEISKTPINFILITHSLSAGGNRRVLIILTQVTWTEDKKRGETLIKWLCFDRKLWSTVDKKINQTELVNNPFRQWKLNWTGQDTEEEEEDREEAGRRRIDDRIKNRKRKNLKSKKKTEHMTQKDEKQKQKQEKE